MYAYKVALEGARGAILCCSLQQGGNNSMLMKDSSFYAEGVSVLVAVAPRKEYGIILGAVPFSADGKDLVVRDVISNASQNTPDAIDNACLDLATEDEPYVGISNFAQMEPIDNTSIGSAGYTSVMGSKFYINPFMNSLSVNDYTGIWEFVDDSLMRVSGLNLEIRAAGKEDSFLNDNGEYIEYKGSVVYPWEQLGKTKAPYNSENIILETDEDDYREEGTWKAYVEPREENTKPFHRITDYGGWLGQGKYTQIVAPDPEKDWVKFNDKEKLLGVVRETKSLDGYISSISASATYIGKRGMIPTVSRVNQPDETSTKIGDNDTNYKKTNKFEAEAEIPGNGNPMEHVMGLQDSIAYQQNYKELLPFLQHTNDYYIPEDSELNEGLTRFAKFSQLKNKHVISIDKGPEVKIVTGGNIPERKMELNPAEAGLACLSDGSQVLYGGCGEEIRMAGGSIFFDAPGDIWIKAGRRIILWGGDDIEVRAKGSIDMTSTEESIRIKAEEKLSMLGGNNGIDGVLIESKGSTTQYDFEKGGNEDAFGGIMLKSRDGIIGALGATIYLRSGTGTGGEGIFLDAKNGEQSIYTFCHGIENYVEYAFNINYSNLKTGVVEASDSFIKDIKRINGNAQLTKTLMMGDTLMVGGSIITVGSLAEGQKAMKPDIDKAIDSIEGELPQAATDQYDLIVTQNLASEKHIANEEILETSGFTFRNSEEYDLQEDFAVYEARWQNIAGHSGNGTTAWEEKPVVNGKYEESYTFPGKDSYTETPCYITQEWTLTDYYTGLYKDRWSGNEAASDYKDPKFGEQQKKALNEYPVL